MKKYMVMQVGQTWIRRQGEVLNTSKWHCLLWENMLAMEICPWTLLVSFPRRERFSNRGVGGKLRVEKKRAAWMLAYTYVTVVFFPCLLCNRLFKSKKSVKAAVVYSFLRSAGTRQSKSLILWGDYNVVRE